VGVEGVLTGARLVTPQAYEAMTIGGAKVCRRAQRDVSNERIFTSEELERRQFPQSLAVAVPHARRL
jgi:hypothetical protein